MNRWEGPIELADEADFTLGGAHVRPALRQFTANGIEETLEPRVMQVLVALHRRANDVVTRDELVAVCWEGRVVGEDAIHRAIAKTRRLGETSRAFAIETIPRVGYRLKRAAAETAQLDALIAASAAPRLFEGVDRPMVGGPPAFDWASMAAAAKPSPPWTLPEAFLAILIAAAASDGMTVPVEQELLVSFSHRSRALKGLDDNALAAAITAATERLREGGDAALAQACDALPLALRQPLFAQALDIVLADGELTQAEASFLNTLVMRLHLAEADVRRIADVILLKNRA